LTRISNPPYLSPRGGVKRGKEIHPTSDKQEKEQRKEVVE
jgi:hypothetical protein